MAFNASGGSDGPTVVRFPNLDRLPKFPFGIVVVVLLLVISVFGSFYTVDPEEVGVVLRFGKLVRQTEPGFQFKIPFGVEEVYKVPVQRQLKEEFGFKTVATGTRTQYSQSDFDDESLMLTGDLNVADVEWVVQYRIVDPANFLFRIRNAPDTLRDLSEAVMRQVVGDRTVNETLTVGRQEVATLVEDLLQDLCDQYETGIRIEQVVLQNVTPPDPVKPSFNEVNQAEQEREQKINAAQTEYNQVIFRAEGEAQETIEQAEGYAVDRVNRSEGDAALFNALYVEYRKAPEVTRKRLYLETMNSVLPEVGSKVVLDEDARGLLPLLNLDGSRPGGNP